MTNSNDIHAENEIDLREIITALWRGKFFIIFCTTVSIVFASYNLRHEEKKYSIIYKLKPVNQKDNGPNLSGLGGIASLAGINLPSSSSSDFNVFKELIYSNEVSHEIIKNKDKSVKSINNNIRSSVRKLNPILKGIVGKKVDVAIRDL